MPMFRKKPVVIEAVQWTGDNLHAILEFVGKAASWGPTTGMRISTFEGAHHASIDDWIIKGVAGEFYPCKPDIFTDTYDRT